MFRYISFTVANNHGDQSLKSAYSAIVVVGLKRIDGWQRNRQVLCKTKEIKCRHKDVYNDNGSREK